jgi:hypothetical protein
MRAFLPLLLVALSLGCTTELTDGASFSVIDNDSTAAVTYGTPATVSSQRFHYGVKNDIWVGANKPAAFGHFDLLPRGKVDVTLTHSDGRRSVSFKVYRVNPTGTLRLLGEVRGRRSVTARVESTAGGTIVIESTGTWGERQDVGMNVVVACTRRDGQCAVNRQPGELCGTRGSGSCDEGLFCDFVDGSCGATDAGGTCVAVPDVCNRMCGETCGCDGQTYCSACTANTAGVSVAHEGACDVVDPVCDPTVYTKVPNEQLNVFVHGTWRYRGTVDGYDVDAELGLYDGDFGYEQTWNPTCLRGDPPCRVASRYFWSSGGWSHTSTDVQLHLDPESQPAAPELAQAFSIVQNCEGDLRLNTTELGNDRTFVRDWCANVECSETEHCEVRQMMCITAPCPPQPTCVAN